MFDVDRFVDEVEAEFCVKLDREKCKLAYLDGAITQFQFVMEQQGKEVSNDKLEEFEKLVRERLGL